MYDKLYRMVIGRVDAERAHRMAILLLAAAERSPGGLRMLARLAPEPDDRLRLRVLGLPLANPLGVAAGLDKNGEAVRALIALGFGHVEVGTVTLRPQPGNPRPRLWRVYDHGVAINAMGFPSDGAAAVRARMIRLRPRGVVGINIGKNRETTIDDAPANYAGLVSTLFDVANYITINVSSPNTPGLRSLQMVGELERIIGAVNRANEQAADLARRRPKPVLVKIAPDLGDDEIQAIAEVAVAHGTSGIIATNTTTSREGVPIDYKDLPGGLSGKPLKARANHVVRVLYGRVGNRIPIVGVGGITTGADAVERIRSGATLVQTYTGFSFGGPGTAGRILREMSDDADQKGWRSILEIVGADIGTDGQ